MATTVTSDAEFKTYVEGLTAFTTDTVYMNDDSKYWTFTRENNGKINAMCVTSNNVELWMYDGTDWVINRVPSVVDNLTTDSAIAALSAKQGKLLNGLATQSSKIYRFYMTDGAVAAGGQPALTQSFASDDLFYVSNGVIKCRYEGTIQIATHIIGSTSNNSSGRLWAEIKGGNMNPQLLKYGNYASADNV